MTPVCINDDETYWDAVIRSLRLQLPRSLAGTSVVFTLEPGDATHYEFIASRVSVQGDSRVLQSGSLVVSLHVGGRWYTTEVYDVFGTYVSFEQTSRAFGTSGGNKVSMSILHAVTQALCAAGSVGDVPPVEFFEGRWPNLVSRAG